MTGFHDPCHFTRLGSSHACYRVQGTTHRTRSRAFESHRRDVASGREQLIDTAADAGDVSMADESESEDFTESELDTTMLQQVQAALRRIENGTYGQCLVDGGPIDPKRLDAVPWAPYCTRHQKLLEAAFRPKPSL